MFLTRFFRSRKSTLQTFRPAVVELEDRTVPSGFWQNFFQPPGPATHLQVVTPAQVQAGKEFGIFVTAEDASNRTATAYAGTVHFTLTPGDAGPGVSIPVDYTFTSHDHGFHEFDFTLATLGGQAITATDTAPASTITGSASTNVNPAPVATHFLVKDYGHTVPGVPTNVTVIALDASNHVVPNYAGVVAITTTDNAAVLPSSHTFVAGDHGAFTFQVTFNTAGTTPTITAKDANSLTGTASITVDTVEAVTHFGIYTLGVALAGFPTPVQIVALDANNHQVAGYTGTVHFTSSDLSAGLPADYLFSAADKGSHLFSVTFAARGKQTLTAGDGSITAKVNYYVISHLPIFPGNPWHW